MEMLCLVYGSARLSVAGLSGATNVAHNRLLHAVESIVINLGAIYCRLVLSLQIWLPDSTRLVRALLMTAHLIQR